MNQIICTSNSNLDLINKNYSKQKFFKMFFYILSSISLFLLLFYIFFIYDRYKSEKISKLLVYNFNISNIYNENSEYLVNKINHDEILYSSKNLPSYVIGIIEIKKINIFYPILSELSKDFLKISPCKFYGPNPNEIGNLCIVAHNYKNDSFFSNISTLTNGDIITIYDSNANSIDYIVFNIYTVSSNNLDCISQNTNNSRRITLITCDSRDNNYRTIVKAKQL